MIELPSVYDVPEWKKKRIMYQLIGVVSKIVGYEVWLKDGPQPMTDGKYVWVPFGSRTCLLDFDHEISHLLFDSDLVARKMFVKEYTRRLIRNLAKGGNQVVSQSGFQDKLESTLSFFINILDDFRVDSLWTSLFPGSGKYVRLDAQDHINSSNIVNDARQNLLSFLMCLGYDVEVKDARAELIAVQDVLEEAVDEVYLADFITCLAVCKKTLDRIINVLIDEMEKAQDLGQHQSAPDPRGKGTSATAAAVASLFGDEDKKVTQQQPGKQDKNQQKAGALAWLVGMSNPAAVQKSKKNDQKDPKFVPHAKAKAAKQKSDQALGINPHNASGMAQLKIDGRQQMRKVMDQLTDSYKEDDPDDWLTENAMCPVEFVDPDDTATINLSQEEHETAMEARAIFNRILGRKRESLEEEGTLIDVESVLQRRFDPTVREVFIHEGRDMGFYALILLDLSGSVQGERYRRLAHACSILREALDYPFAQLDVWGFTSEYNISGAPTRGPGGTVYLWRFKDGGEGALINSDGGGKAWQLTPLHHAASIASRECMKHPGVRRLFILSDGWPVYQGPHGKSYPAQQLIDFTAMNIKDARENRVGVYGLMVGSFDEAKLDKMFQERRYWQQTDRQDESDALVNLVEENFRDYIQEYH